jgi:hypothetical protein
VVNLATCHLFSTSDLNVILDDIKSILLYTSPACPVRPAEKRGWFSACAYAGNSIVVLEVAAPAALFAVLLVSLQAQIQGKATL